MSVAIKTYITIDIDWAPEEVIEDTLSLLKEYNVSATLFCTHKSDVINNADIAKYEKAIHPNFNFLLQGKNTNGNNAEDVLDSLLTIYPEAKGIRSHSMTQSSMLLDLFVQKGLQYDANHFLPYQNIMPFTLWNGLIRIPYNWEDDVHFAYNKKFENPEFEFADNELLIVDFHPMHIFLNTENAERYKAAKPHYQNVKELLKFRNDGKEKKGVRDVFIQLLVANKNNNNLLYTLANSHKSYIQ